MKKLFAASLFALLSLALAVPALAADRATLDEAKAMVKKARQYIQKNGREKAFAEIDKRDGMFVDRDLYVYVYDKNLKNLAHGGNPRLIGKDLADMRDPDGKYVNKGLLKAAMNGGGTFTFKFLNPATNKIETKTGYAEMEGDIMVGSGVYVANE